MKKFAKKVAALSLSAMLLMPVNAMAEADVAADAATDAAADAAVSTYSADLKGLTLWADGAQVMDVANLTVGMDYASINEDDGMRIRIDNEQGEVASLVLASKGDQIYLEIHGVASDTTVKYVMTQDKLEELLAETGPEISVAADESSEEESSSSVDFDETDIHLGDVANVLKATGGVLGVVDKCTIEEGGETRTILDHDYSVQGLSIDTEHAAEIVDEISGAGFGDLGAYLDEIGLQFLGLDFVWGENEESEGAQADAGVAVGGEEVWVRGEAVTEGTEETVRIGIYDAETLQYGLQAVVEERTLEDTSWLPADVSDAVVLTDMDVEAIQEQLATDCEPILNDLIENALPAVVEGVSEEYLDSLTSELESAASDEGTADGTESAETEDSAETEAPAETEETTETTETEEAADSEAAADTEG